MINITFELKDDKNRLLVPQSAVSGAFYTLYLVKNPEDSNKFQLAYPLCNSEQQFPEILQRGDSNPIALFGGFRDAAAIDNEGRILFISKEVLESTYMLLIIIGTFELFNGNQRHPDVCFFTEDLNNIKHHM